MWPGQKDEDSFYLSDKNNLFNEVNFKGFHHSRLLYLGQISLPNFEVSTENGADKLYMFFVSLPERKCGGEC